MSRVHDEAREQRPRPATAPARRPASGVAGVLALQRSAGNHAVARMLAREPALTEAPPAASQPAPKLAVIMHEGQHLAPGIDGCREALERVADAKGADSASAWASRFYNMSAIERASLDAQHDPELVSGTIDSLRAAEAQFEKDNEEFLHAFEARAGNLADEMLTTSQEKIKAEQARIGLSENEFDSSSDHDQMARVKASAALLLAKRKEVDALQKAAEDAQATFEQHARADPFKIDVAPRTTAEAARTAWSEGEKQFDALARQETAAQPLLAMYTTGGEVAGKLASITGSAPDDDRFIAHHVQHDLQKKLANIAEVRGNLGGRFNVYKQPPLVSLAKQSMNAKPYQSRLVDDHIKQVNAAEEDSKLFWSALALGLGLLAALPTAGSSLAAGLAVAGAGVSAYQAYEHVMNASLQAAAAGSDMDKALAITQDEPNYLWLALDIVGVVMDVVAAGAAFKALRATMGASKLQDIASMQKLAGQCDAAKLSPIARGRVFASVMAEAGGDMTSTLEQMIQVFRQLKAPAGDAKVLEYAAKMAEEMIAEGKVITIRAGHEVEDVTEHLMRTGSPRQASGKALGYLDEFKPGTMGTYIAGEDVILLRTNASPEMVASVFVHEITHRKQSAMELLDGFTKFEAELSAHASQREFMRLIPREAIPEQWRWLRDADDHVLHWAVAQTYKIPDEVVLGGRSAMWRAMRKEVRGRGL